MCMDEKIGKLPDACGSGFTIMDKMLLDAMQNATNEVIMQVFEEVTGKELDIEKDLERIVILKDSQMSNRS